MKLSRLQRAGLIVLLLAFAYFIWPTRYRYTRYRFPTGTEVPMRIDRFTGRGECMISMPEDTTMGGWRSPCLR